MLPFPFKDDKGNIVFFDISYIFPWSMPLSVASHLREMDLAGAYGEIGHGGPVLGIYAGLKTNTHPFYGTELWLEGDSGPVKFGKAMEFVWNTMAPGIATTERSNPPVKFAAALRGETDLYGNPPPTKGDAFARMFGWNLYRIDTGVALAKNLQVLSSQMDTFYRQQMSLIKRETSPDRREEMIDYLKQRMLRKGMDIVEYRFEAGEIDEAQRDQQIEQLNQEIANIGAE